MNPHLNDDAVAFAEVAAKAFAGAGGIDLARRAEADPDVRRTEVASLLANLGLDDLDATASPEEAEAVAALCAEAGRVVLPYPVVGAALASGGAAPLALGSGADRAVDHADLFDRWRLVTIDGDGAAVAPVGSRLGTKLGPFVGDTSDEGEMVAVDPLEVALHLTLTAFVVAGGLARAVELAVAHVVEREQFGKPLAAFQAVQFQLADAHVAVAGVEATNLFALWRCHAAPDEAVADALAARSGALDAARSVLRIAQQLHGASGMCDEYDVSIIVRHLQPALRLPFGALTTAEHLAVAIERVGFAGLFPHGAQRT